MGTWTSCRVCVDIVVYSRLCRFRWRRVESTEMAGLLAVVTSSSLLVYTCTRISLPVTLHFSHFGTAALPVHQAMIETWFILSDCYWRSVWSRRVCDIRPRQPDIMATRFKTLSSRRNVDGERGTNSHKPSCREADMIVASCLRLMLQTRALPLPWCTI